MDYDGTANDIFCIFANQNRKWIKEINALPFIIWSDIM